MTLAVCVGLVLWILYVQQCLCDECDPAKHCIGELCPLDALECRTDVIPGKVTCHCRENGRKKRSIQENAERNDFKSANHPNKSKTDADTLERKKNLKKTNGNKTEVANVKNQNLTSSKNQTNVSTTKKKTKNSKLPFKTNNSTIKAKLNKTGVIETKVTKNRRINFKKGKKMKKAAQTKVGFRKQNSSKNLKFKSKANRRNGFNFRKGSSIQAKGDKHKANGAKRNETAHKPGFRKKSKGVTSAFKRLSKTNYKKFAGSSRVGSFKFKVPPVTKDTSVNNEKKTKGKSKKNNLIGMASSSYFQTGEPLMGLASSGLGFKPSDLLSLAGKKFRAGGGKKHKGGYRSNKRAKKHKIGYKSKHPSKKNRGGFRSKKSHSKFRSKGKHSKYKSGRNKKPHFRAGIVKKPSSQKSGFRLGKGK